MATKTQYVKQCTCCDKRFSRFNTPILDVIYEAKLDTLMKKKIRAMKLRGEFELVVKNDFITGFYYEYANPKEEGSSNLLCNSLYDIACDFYESNLSEVDDCIFEEEFA